MPVKDSKKTNINGKEYELFYISNLAFALGRSEQTIRKWEISGVLPNSCFKDRFGRRMYTQTQIDIIVSIAEECKIKQGASIANTSFSSKVHKALAEHNKIYLKKSN
jgi:DNA-binding transcriptional MerR regulator